MGDDGACVLFDSLRMNRTLLSLGLAGNGIGDAGAKKVAEVLSKFPLTHEELVERRKLMAGKESHERKSVSVSTPALCLSLYMTSHQMIGVFYPLFSYRSCILL